MTEQEAIKQLQFDMDMITFNPNTGEDISLEVLKLRNKENYKTYLADEVAIKALEEIQKYREIGTVEECRVAVEKHIPKRPDIEGDGYADGHLVYDTWICPNCNKHYEIDYDNYEYCHNCGQHIDRSQLNYDL